jgi:hypothetical protein
MPPTTFRADVGNGLMDVFSQVQTAAPDLLARYYRARPEAFSQFPCVYIDRRPETIMHDSGTRNRNMSPSIVMIDQITENQETEDRIDQLVDVMIDALTANPQLAEGTIWSRMTLADESAEVGDFLYMAVRITLENISIREGRI